jgi:formylglycine-generating enzyme required for sulfatase activity
MIGNPFAVGKFELTFAEWEACVAGGGCTGNKSPKDAMNFGKGRRPVINVSWDNANEYVGWLSRKTGKMYRLLSEAEWEYAARAGTTTPFSTRSTITTDQANFNGDYTYGGNAKGANPMRTVEVGAFQPNAFGLYDMHGNVAEWVEDCWHGSYQGAPTNGSAWTTSCTERDERVLRGGSFRIGPEELRSACRWKGISWVQFYQF